MKPGEQKRFGGKVGATLFLFDLCFGKVCPAMKQIKGWRRGVMERNAGSRERSGVKDTVAARSKGRGAVGSVPTLRQAQCDRLCRIASLENPLGHCSFANTINETNSIYWQCCNGLAHLLADPAFVRPYYLLGGGVVVITVEMIFVIGEWYYCRYWKPRKKQRQRSP